ncbi:hypothetical protein EYF80_002975 [Liparis tanakae]|uniref:Uncharacterized protein n=1 Tax=Liparis tanakae TaxID=230148 RepID=A0A4Z2JBU0_9TELE|nr:hypothetical protein EYF80_002975 [Liparis tanakae]
MLVATLIGIGLEISNLLLKSLFELPRLRLKKPLRMLISSRLFNSAWDMRSFFSFFSFLSKSFSLSFLMRFLFEVHSSVESVSKEMAGPWFGTPLPLSRDMEEVFCRATLPQSECLSSSNSGLLSEYKFICCPAFAPGSQHAENNTLKTYIQPSEGEDPSTSTTFLSSNFSFLDVDNVEDGGRGDQNDLKDPKSQGVAGELGLLVAVDSVPHQGHQQDAEDEQHCQPYLADDCGMILDFR